MKRTLQFALFLLLFTSLSFAQTDNKNTCSDSKVLSAATTLTVTIENCGGMTGSFEYIFAGSPSASTQTLSGCPKQGTCSVLDTYTGNANSHRKPVIDAAYAYFKIVGTFTGGTTPSVTINSLLTIGRNGTGSTITGAVASVNGNVGVVVLGAADVGAAPLVHTHAESDVTSLVSDLAGKAATVHTHTESQITNLTTDLAGKSAVGHTHVESDTTNLVSDLAGKAATSHTHTEGQVTNLTSDLAAKEAIANKDTDTALAANSDVKYASQKATKAYVDALAAITVPVTAPPALVISPTSLPFGTVTTGQDSNPLTLTLTNPGRVPVHIASINSSNTDYIVTNPGALTLPPQGTFVLLPIFHPTSPGAEPTSNITVVSDAVFDPGTSGVIPLTGAGTALATFVASVNFDPASTGSGTISTVDGLINGCHGGGGQPQIGQCFNNYVTGSTPTFNAVPDGAATFDGFNCPSCQTAPYVPTITAATNIKAGFTLPIPSFTISIVGPGQGTLTVTDDTGAANCISTAGVLTSGGGQGCTPSFPLGTLVHFHATVNGSSTFVTWINAPPSCGTNTNCDITVSSSFTLSANASVTVAPISLAQSSTNCSVAGTTIGCPWGQAQQAADLNVCFATISDTSTTVSGVSDTINGAYTQVPTISPKLGTGIQEIAYYKQNIAAAASNTNTTTMTLSSSVSTNISVANKTLNHSAVAGTTFTTASSTPASNKLQLLVVNGFLNSGNGPGHVSTVTGNGLTWVMIAGVDSGPSVGTAFASRLEIWRAMGSSPSAGAITITWPVSVTGSGWSLDEVTGMDTTGTNGSGAIGIVSFNGSTSSVASPATVTMGTFNSSANGTFMGSGALGGLILTAGTGLTDLGHDSASPAPVNAGWATGNVSPVQSTYAAQGNAFWGIIGIEIKVPSNRRDMRCLEYSGVLASGSPIDQVIAATGTGTAVATGPLTTTVANDLLTGATTSTTTVSTADTSHNYIQQLKDTFGDDEEDQQGVATAAYNFQPTLGSSGNWVAMLIGWKPSGAPAPSTFSITLVASSDSNGGGITTSNAGTPPLNCTGNGAVSNPTPACSTAVIPGSTIRLTAQPLQGSIFNKWTGGGAGCGSQPTCDMINVTSNQVVGVSYVLSGTQLYWVGGTGASDSNDGLSATVTGGHGPWLTIPGSSGHHSDSIVNLGPGGTVVNIADGTYSGPIQSNKGGTSNTQRIIYRSTNKWGAKITTVNWTVNASFIDVDGIDGTSPGTGTNIGVQINGGTTGVRVLNTNLHDFDVAGCAQFGIIGVGSGQATTLAGQAIDAVIKNNVIRHISAYNGTGPNTHSCITAHGIYDFGVRTIIQNNWISASAGPAIERVSVNGTAGQVQGVISNNDIVNNGGGININESIDSNPVIPWDHSVIENNIIVNNGTDDTVSGGACGIDYFHVTGLNNLGTNNLIYGNKPHDLCHHNQVQCGTDASGATPVTGKLIDGSDANGTGGCPAFNSQTDSAGVTATFAAFVADLPTSPITPSSSFDITKYYTKSTSKAKDNGDTQCASSPGVCPATPSTDINGVIRPLGARIDIGITEQ